MTYTKTFEVRSELDDHGAVTTAANRVTTVNSMTGDVAGISTIALVGGGGVLVAEPVSETLRTKFRAA